MKEIGFPSSLRGNQERVGKKAGMAEAETSDRGSRHRQASLESGADVGRKRRSAREVTDRARSCQDSDVAMKTNGNRKGPTKSQMMAPADKAVEGVRAAGGAEHMVRGCGGRGAVDIIWIG